MDTATIERPHHRCAPGATTEANDGRGTTAPPETRARQREVSSIGVLVLGVVIAASLRADLFAPDHSVLVDPGALRAMSLAVAVGFLAYAIEQDRRLRALEARHDTPTTAPPPADVAVPLRMHHALLLGEVVDAVLADVQDVFAAAGVELRLVGFDGRARCAGRRGDRSGTTQTVALQQRGRVVGELIVHGPLRADDDRFVAIGELASAALVRARRHEHTMNVLGELRDAVAPKVVTLVD